MGDGKPSGTEATVSTGGMGQVSTSSPQLAPGTMVGEYQIERQIGEGGMGRVFAAIHPVIAKRAAIKVLHPEFSVNREMVERFVQEARSVNQIGHPNIVDIFAFGALPDGRCYFVMEHLHGESLRERITKRRLALPEILAILDTVTSALAAAHEQGIVHRDLKPDNIFVVEHKNAQPEVKLLDFGIAKLLGDDGRVQRTQTGNLMGTPGYISPEQARGQGVDHRTDVYALGAVAYELMTGWLPFPADNAADMIAKHLFAPVPSVRAKNGDVPHELDVTVTAMMAKDANQRPTLQAFHALIAQYRYSGSLPTMAMAGGALPVHAASGMSTPPPGGSITAPHGVASGAVLSAVHVAPRRSRAWLVVTVAALAVAGVVIAIVATREGSSEPAATPPAGTEVAGPAGAGAAGGDAASPANDATRATAAVPPVPDAAPAIEVVQPTAAPPTEVAKRPVAAKPAVTVKPRWRPPATADKPEKPRPPKPPDDDDAPMD